MKKILSKLSLFILLWLSFVMLLLSGYWFYTGERLIAVVVAALSIVSIIVSIHLMKSDKNQTTNQNTETDSDQYHTIVPKSEKNLEPEIDETNIEETKIYKKEELVSLFETDEAQTDKKPLTNQSELDGSILNLDIPIKSDKNYDFEDHFNDFINDMIDKDMFLKSLDYIDAETIKDHAHKLNQKIYKYQFHPIPLVALIKSVRKDEGYKVMVGINSKSMRHVANLPSEYLDEVEEIYPTLQNIKGHISGGAYVEVDNFENINYDTEDLMISLRLYH